MENKNNFYPLDRVNALSAVISILRDNPEKVSKEIREKAETTVLSLLDSIANSAKPLGG